MIMITMMMMLMLMLIIIIIISVNVRQGIHVTVRPLLFVQLQFAYVIDYIKTSVHSN